MAKLSGGGIQMNKNVSGKVRAGPPNTNVISPRGVLSYSVRRSHSAAMSLRQRWPSRPLWSLNLLDGDLALKKAITGSA